MLDEYKSGSVKYPTMGGGLVSFCRGSGETHLIGTTKDPQGVGEGGERTSC